MGNKFNWQSFISIGLLFSFFIMLFSGIILYVAPEGSLSRWIGWDVLNLTKKQWEHQHTIFSYLFILFSVLHVFKINWGFLISYFVIEKFKFRYLKEITIAIIVTVLVFLGTFLNWSPFRAIIEFGADISDHYTVNIEIPNIPDAEKLSLNDFAENVFNISYGDLVSMLDNYDFDRVNKDTSVIDFCDLNEISPSEFYMVLMNKQVQNGSEETTVLGGFSEVSSYLNNKYTIL